MRCKICKKKFKSPRSLSAHLKAMKGKDKHPISIQTYYNTYLKKETEGICRYCLQPTKFQGIVKGYLPYCSRECVKLDAKNRIKKTKKTMIERYGVDNCSKLDWVKEKKINTCYRNFSVDYPFQSEIIKRKGMLTSQENWGVKHPSSSPVIRAKVIKTLQARYGVTNPLQIKDVQNKVIIENQKRFLELLLSSDRLKSIEPAFELFDYKGVKYKYEWKCKTCGTLFTSNLDNGKYLSCPTCYPRLIGGSSYKEDSLFDFCNLYFDNIIRNDRTILDGKEIDILIPEINLGIEFNGLYWHSELLGGYTQQLHKTKTLNAKSKNIHLIHIFEDEWIEKQDIIKSILRSKFKKIEHKIYGRKCKLTELDWPESKLFLLNNHLQDYHPGRYYFSLTYKDDIVALLVIGKPRFDKRYEWEILRFCNKKDSIVLGGFSKLLSYFIKNYHPKSIITYADARFGYGKVYKRTGFSLKGHTAPNYYYLDSNHIKRFSRFQFQKHKLEHKLDFFNSELTEWENMVINGYDRIWDCGNYVYELTN